MKRSFAFLILATLVTPSAFANVYSCAKMVYKDGWLTKYQYLGETIGANTKKHGLPMSTTGAMIEQTTSSVDPGVTSGRAISTSQYSSSWGECAAIEMIITREFREKYIDQNMPEIRRQAAIGRGYHVDALATLSGCDGSQREFAQRLQARTADLYPLASGSAWAPTLDLLCPTT